MQRRDFLSSALALAAASSLPAAHGATVSGGQPWAPGTASLPALPKVRQGGLAFFSQHEFDTAAVREALAAVVAGGTPTVLLTSNLSDLPGAVYVGIDNHAAGRCAGGLLSQSTHGRPGAALLVVNSLLYDAHRQRAKGFMEVMAAKAPGTRILGPLECFDNDGLAEIAVQAALQNTELVGIYDTGSSSAGIAAALRRGGARPTWVGHEANAQHAALLRDGALSVVLDQDPEGQVQAGIEWLLHRHGVLEVPPLTQLALRIVIEENLPGLGQG